MRAELESETSEEVTVRFSVSDTGIGVDEAGQKNLFQAFTQADGSTTRKYGGTGLGLAISKQLVELMGGQIGMFSQPGKGSTFWFSARFEEQPLGSEAAQANRASIEKLHALIVDDNAANRKTLAHQLNSWGITYDQADSGPAAGMHDYLSKPVKSEEPEAVLERVFADADIEFQTAAVSSIGIPVLLPRVRFATQRSWV